MKEKFDYALEKAQEAIQSLKEKIDRGETLTGDDEELIGTFVNFFPAPLDITPLSEPTYHRGQRVRLKGFGVEYDSPIEYEVITHSEIDSSGTWFYAFRERLGWWEETDFEPYELPAELELKVGDRVRLLRTDFRWSIGTVVEIESDYIIGVDVSDSPLDQISSRGIDVSEGDPYYLPIWALEKIKTV